MKAQAIQVTHVNGPPTRIPNTPAGQRCKDVLYSLAKKMFNAGNEATHNFIQANFPAAKTVGKEYADRKFKRIVECEDGSLVAVVYDYMIKTTWACAPDD
jgi:thymidine phosphorylase